MWTKAREVTGLETFFSLKKYCGQATGGSDSKNSAEYSDRAGRSAQIIIERPNGV
jgi:hypothetical protein